MAMPWRPSLNRGIYYGPSQNNTWNNEEAWRAYVTKTDTLDAFANHDRAEKEKRQLLGSRTGTRMTTRRTGTFGRQTVDGLVKALKSEQDQREQKEKLLEDLLMEETVARVQAQEQIKHLNRKLIYLTDRLQEPGMPLHGQKKKDILNRSTSKLK